jgi:hypothetical protein
MGHDAQPRLRLERGSLAVVAEPHALELTALVLEREVRVPGRRDRHTTDLALDPQVGEARLGPHGASNGSGDLADLEDSHAKGAGGGRAGTRDGRGGHVVDVIPAGQRPVRWLGSASVLAHLRDGTSEGGDGGCPAAIVRA